MVFFFTKQLIDYFGQIRGEPRFLQSREGPN